MVFYVLTIPAALYALFGAYAALRTFTGVRPLPDRPEAPASWPRVSIIVPACNEEGTLRDATASKLASDYPDLEVVIVDDRSTDGTPGIADALAAGDPRVRVVHVKELPAGWLGKLHALDRGVHASSGDYLLFSDADVHMDADVMRRVIAVAEKEELGFVALFPRVWESGFVVDLAMTAMLRQLVVAGRSWKVSDPRSSVCVGSGVFNLVRRTAFAATPGFPWLKLEIVDDIALGQMMKRAGARCALFNASTSLGLHFYRSAGEMMRGTEKNGFSVLGRLRLYLALLAAAALILVEVGPLVALVYPGAPMWARALGGAALVVTSLLQATVAWWGKRSALVALVPVLGPLTCLFFLMRGVVLAILRGGVVWRGTKYSLRELRAGIRIAL